MFLDKIVTAWTKSPVLTFKDNMQIKFQNLENDSNVHMVLGNYKSCATFTLDIASLCNLVSHFS